MTSECVLLLREPNRHQYQPLVEVGAGHYGIPTKWSSLQKGEGIFFLVKTAKTASVTKPAHVKGRLKIQEFLGNPKVGNSARIHKVLGWVRGPGAKLPPNYMTLFQTCLCISTPSPNL